ncbi:Chitinase 1 [Linnemannia zychae]|nr:Chitinase 1 [Linnemannia zychae]
MSSVSYTEDGTVNVFALAFISQIQNGKPILNFASHCVKTFPGSPLLDCPKIGQDIKACQANGKTIVLSVGGASGAYSLPDAASGRAFADQVWDLFLGGSSNTRPFRSAVLDGIDLDLELGQNYGYAAFVDALRGKFSSGSRPFYITAAPQCPYPDVATKEALEQSWFDLVWVQFYNNYCGVNNFSSGSFNFATWNNWATTVSKNKDVRILLGVPGGPGAAGSGVISAAQLNTILAAVKSYSNFGGVMMWDTGIARQSGLAASAARFLRGFGSDTPDILQPLAPPSIAVPTITPLHIDVPTITAPTTPASPEVTSAQPVQQPTPTSVFDPALTSFPTPAPALAPGPEGVATPTTTLDVAATTIPTLKVQVSDDGKPVLVHVHVHNSTLKDFNLEWLTAWDWQGRPYKILSSRLSQPSLEAAVTGFDIVVEATCRE